jgi:hypothetical protein
MIIDPNIINKSVFEMKMHCAFCEVGIESLSIIAMNFGLESVV